MPESSSRLEKNEQVRLDDLIAAIAGRFAGPDFAGMRAESDPRVRTGFGLRRAQRRRRLGVENVDASGIQNGKKMLAGVERRVDRAPFQHGLLSPRFQQLIGRQHIKAGRLAANMHR